MFRQFVQNAEKKFHTKDDIEKHVQTFVRINSGQNTYQCRLKEKLVDFMKGLATENADGTEDFIARRLMSLRL